MNITATDSEQPDLRRLRTWHAYVTLLSVEPTEAYITELSLPLEEQHFLPARYLARVCLEIFLYSSVDKALKVSTGFSEAWHRYRKAEGILSDEALHKFVAGYPQLGGYEKTHVAFDELQGWVGQDMRTALKDWFVRNYLPARGGFQAMVSMLCQLTKQKPSEPVAALSRITDTQRRAVQEFCSRYYDNQAKLRKRFRETHEASKRGRPTAWEAVLQTFPVDSYAGDYYPWLLNIRDCLILKMFRHEWARLRSELGPVGFEHLTTSVREEADHFLGEQSIFDEPAIM